MRGHNCIISAMIVVLLQAGCSGTQSTAQLGTAPLSREMYPLTAEVAERVLATAMTAEFPGSPISRVDLPNRGYQATVKFLIDYHTIVAYMIPAKGRDAAGELVDGFVFEVNNAGTMPLSGGKRANKVFARIVREAALKSPALPMVSFAP